MGGASPGTSGGLLRASAASRRAVRGSLCPHVGRAYATVKNGVTNINALKRAALRDKALGALRDLASGAQFIDQVSARHVVSYRHPPRPEASTTSRRRPSTSVIPRRR